MAASKTEDQEERQKAEMAYLGFLEEAERESIKFLKHDSRAHDDEALYRIVNRHGMAWYGLYWLLAEHLAARKDHSYDVSDDSGWRRLTLDLGCMCDMTVDDCKLFIAELAAVGLVCPEHLAELHKVVITRIRKDAQAYAHEVAMKRLGAWKTNRKKMIS